MDQLSQETSRIAKRRAPRPRRKIVRMALRWWRVASLLGRLSEIAAWLAG